MDTLQKPSALPIPFANNGTKNTIPSAPTGTNLASLSEGFPGITSEPIASGGVPPVRADFNGIINLTTSQYYYLQNGGVFTFDASVSSAIGGYPLGAILYYTDGNGVTYRVKSNKANNTDNFVTTPAFIGDSWDIVSDTPQNLMPYIGDIKTSVRSANHGNWFLCDGQAVSRTTYATLFSIIGTNFGDGDGSTTFNLPDYRGKFLRGLGGDSAADIYTTQAEGLPAVPYSRYPQNQTARFDVYSSSGGNHAPNQITFQNAQATTDIYGASEHVTPINMAVNYFIKAL